MTFADLEDVDPDLSKNLHWLLNNKNVEEIYQTFSYEIDILDKRITKNLILDGYNIIVDDNNKKEYVKRLCLEILNNQSYLQIFSFIKGFREIIPLDLMSTFTASDLELIIAGMQEIDVDEMKTYVVLSGFANKEVELIVWLFEILQDFNQSERAIFLYFISGIND